MAPLTLQSRHARNAPKRPDQRPTLRLECREENQETECQEIRELEKSLGVGSTDLLDLLPILGLTIGTHGDGFALLRLVTLRL